MLLNPRPTACHLKVNSREISVGREGKLALFQSLVTGGEGGLLTENQLPTAAQGKGI